MTHFNQTKSASSTVQSLKYNTQKNHNHKSAHAFINKRRQQMTGLIGKQVHRAKVVAGILDTIMGGYRVITRVDGWQEVNREVMPRYIQIFCRKMAGVFGVEIVALEPIPETHALWVANHISWMDIPVVGSVGPAFLLSKAEVENIPLFGRIAKASGNLFIKRGSGDSGSIAMQISQFLKQGYSVLFFPEATTTDGTGIKKLHGKLLQAAIDADKPIQPIVICFVNQQGQLDDNIPYTDDISLKNSILRVIDSDPVTAYVLPLAPLFPADHNVEALTDLLQQHMEAGLKTLHDRVLNT